MLSIVQHTILIVMFRCPLFRGPFINKFVCPDLVLFRTMLI